MEGGDFEAAFERLLGPWLGEVPAALPLIASGMIASREGWVETPYLPCPADASGLAGALTEHRSAAGRLVRFMTGLQCRGAAGTPDVMRGEETQIVGCLAAGGGDGLYLLPGTHSKWARVGGGRILSFATFMTGELFAVLKEHTILGRLMEGEAAAPEAFERGLRYGLLEAGEAGGLLRRLFSARSRGLFGDIAAAALADYLSGLLLGAEIREGLGTLAGAGPLGPITLVGQGALVARYAEALRLAGRETRAAEADVVARGHHAIAAAAGLLG